MDRDYRYWTAKHHARTNFEVVRTVANVVNVAIGTVVLLRVFGWL